MEEGSTSTEYESYYQSTQYVYLDEPLRKVGDCADYIDVNTGEVVRMVGKVDQIGFFNNYGLTSNGSFYRHYITLNPAMVKGTRLLGYSNVLPCNVNGWDSWQEEQLYLGQSNTGIYIITSQSYNSWEDLKNYLTNNGQNELEILYQLEAPTTETIEVPLIPNGAKITVLTTLVPSK